MRRSYKTNLPIKTKIFIILILTIAVFSRLGFDAKNIKNTTTDSGYYKVIGIIDGDTIRILKDKETIRVRLHGIDCPEKNQPYYEKAKQFTSKHTYEKTVFINKRTEDRYQRWVADVLLPDGRNLNHLIVENGLGWRYEKYTPNDSTLKNLEKKARKAKINIWSEPDPIPPWKFRKK
ncbi:MAG: thermonuclease family protein [Armatimonadota bacterium]